LQAQHLVPGIFDKHVVSARLGHSTPVVTLNVYAHVLPTSDEQAAEVMAAVVAG
jgi:integrase